MVSFSGSDAELKKVSILLEVQTSGDKKAEKLAAEMKGLSEAISISAKRFDSFSGVLSLSQDKFAQLNKAGVKWSSVGGNFANKLRLATQGLRGFRMEMLSVMFFGMGIKNFFGQWVTGAMDMLGISNLMNTGLQYMVVQAILPFIDAIIGLFTWFMSLPQGVQQTIGAIILAGWGFGMMLQQVGQLSLGIGGLIKFFEEGGTLQKFAGWLSGLGTKTIEFAVSGLSTVKTAILGLFNYLDSTILVPAKTILLKVLDKIEGISNAFLNSMIGVFGPVGGKWVTGAVGAAATLYFGISIVTMKLETGTDWLMYLANALGVVVGAVVLGGAAGISAPVAATVAIAFVVSDILIRTGVMDAVARFIENAGRAIGNFLISTINFILDLLNKITFGLLGNVFDFLKIKNSITKATSPIDLTPIYGEFRKGLATGGIVTSPTRALIGEAGPEAVIPLDKLGNINNNMGGNNINVYASVHSEVDIKELADKLNYYMGLNYNRSNYL